MIVLVGCCVLSVGSMNVSVLVLLMMVVRYFLFVVWFGWVLCRMWLVVMVMIGCVCIGVFLVMVCDMFVCVMRWVCGYVVCVCYFVV